MNDAEGGGFFSSDWKILDLVGFKLPGESHVQSAVGLGVGRLPGVWETIQEVGRCNQPPCLRKQLLTKSVHSELGVLGVSDAVTVDLKDLDSKDGWILESRIDIEVGAEVAGGTEVDPLLVEPLLARILCISRLHGLLQSVDIMQESRSGGRREIFHKLCGWG